MLILLIAIAWVVLLLLTFRAPMPKLDRLIFFVLLLMASGALAYVFLVRVFNYNPNPTRLRIANFLTSNKLVDLTKIVPGVPDLDYITRIDPDTLTQDQKRAWMVFYQYDVHTDPNSKRITGPFGGAIYDYDRCRPPTIYNFELVPVNYDYLGADNVTVEVNNIIQYDDPLSLDQNAMEIDRPEIIIRGISRGAVTDLNIFRKEGVDFDCVPKRSVRIQPSSVQTVTIPFSYMNIGSFRGTYSVGLSDSTVTVKDSAVERSQIVIYRKYQPQNGTYFEPPLATEPGESMKLLPPTEVGLTFGPGQPDQTRQVYYPEKTALAFFLQLGSDSKTALSYTCQGKGRTEYMPQDYGLTLPLNELQQVEVCELSYVPNAVGEQNHAPQQVRLKVLEITTGVSMNCQNARSIECTVAAAPNAAALPYGCEWCMLDCHPVP